MKRAEGALRIIGGEWRSRLVHFDADPRVGLRATPDRVRQTVFDWLSPVIRDARCLDLFAGSGAMGLEALSRGAAHCTFVEVGAAQCRDIRTALASLKGEARAEVVQADARRWLASNSYLSPPGRGRREAPGEGRLPEAAASLAGKHPSPNPLPGGERASTTPFDVVFLDPPFASTLLADVLPQLFDHLAYPHRVYVEWGADARPALPPGFAWIREKQAGQVSYGLVIYEGAA